MASASRSLRDCTLSVIDTETNGLSEHEGARIVEIAIVRVEPGGEISDRYTSLLDPGNGAGPEHIHRISDADLLGAPTYGDIHADVAQRLAGTVVVAHNVEFDLRFLRQEAEHIRATLPEYPTVCTLRAARRWLDIPSKTLESCCEHLGIELTDAHAALADAEATAALVYRLLDEVEPHGKGRIKEHDSFRELVPTAALVRCDAIKCRTVLL